MDAESLQHRGAHPAQPIRTINANWPVRSRELIGQLCTLASQWLSAPMQGTLDHFSDHLFELAKGSRSGFSLQALMASRETVVGERALVERRFLNCVRLALEHTGEHAMAAATELATPLGLVGHGEQAMASALDKMAARGAAHGGQLLFELSYRLAVLVETPPLEGAAMPLGPHALASAFLEATESLDLPDEYRLQLLDSFDHVLLRKVTDLYERINDHLSADGILPKLRPYTVTATPVRNKRHADNDAAGDAVFTPRTEAAQSAAANSSGEPIAVLDSLRALLSPPGGNMATGAASNERMATTAELETALGALQQHLTEVTENASRELRSAQRLREELLTQLNTHRAPGTPPAQLSGEQDDTIELVAMLFEQLAKQMHGDGNTHDILGGLQLPMLRMAVADHGFFEQHEHPARQLLGTIAEATNHWLDSADGEPDRSLQTKLEGLVERASREPPSAGLYTSLLADIEQHLGALKLRAEATEHRHVKAISAHERLDQARRRAASLMGIRFAACRTAPRGLLRALLDRAWTDVLVLTLLREGERGPVCRAQLRITDQLLGLKPTTDPAQLQHDVQAGLLQIGMAEEEASQVAQRLVAPEQTPASGDALSTTELLVHLKQHQRFGAQRTATTAAPVAATTPTVENNPSAVEDDIPVSEKPMTSPPAAANSDADDAKASNEANAPTPPVPSQTLATQAAIQAATPIATQAENNTPPTTHTDPLQRSIRHRLGKLPFGTWFEFTDSDTHRVSQRKLAWYSPMSGQALFVTRRGQRGGEVGLDDLADRIASGHARLLPAVNESLLDRAWRNLASNLRQAGKAKPAQERTP